MRRLTTRAPPTGPRTMSTSPQSDERREREKSADPCTLFLFLLLCRRSCARARRILGREYQTITCTLETGFSTARAPRVFVRLKKRSENCIVGRVRGSILNVPISSARVLHGPLNGRGCVLTREWRLCSGRVRMSTFKDGSGEV